MELAGKTVVVTGGGSGIGRSSAEAFAAAGASVVVADVDPASGPEAVAQIEATGGKAHFLEVDVTDPILLRDMLDEAERVFGGVHVLHNNAGVVCGEPLWPDTDPGTLLRQITVNLAAVVVGTRLAVDHLARHGGGAVVNTASMASLLPLADEPGYSAAKAGVLMFTRTCAPLEATHNIRVTAVLPGLVETPLLQKSGDGQRPAAWVDMARTVLGSEQPDDVARVVVDLAQHGKGGEWRFVGALPDGLKDMMRAGLP
jgi:NAD(P)-dependent dehydrogenase (short-subunit alcohol dehydrogenase family)